MTDPKDAADAAERVQAVLDARPQDDRPAGHILYTLPDPDRTRGRWLHLTEPDLRALLADRKRMAAEPEQVRGCHDTLHDKNSALHELVAELTRAPQQWRLIAPSGRGQVLPREAIADSAPWPDGWTVETRNVRFGPWLPQGAETTATRPAGGPDGTGEGQRTHEAANGAQRGAEGDETEPTS